MCSELLIRRVGESIVFNVREMKVANGEHDEALSRIMTQRHQPELKGFALVFPKRR